MFEVLVQIRPDSILYFAFKYASRAIERGRLAERSWPPNFLCSNSFFFFVFFFMNPRYILLHHHLSHRR